MSGYTQTHSRRYRGRSDRLMRWIGDSVIHLLLVIIALACLTPFLIILSASFSDERALALKGYSLLPQQFSTTGYQFILHKPASILQAYLVTTSVTVLGTLIALTMMSLIAYPLSRKQFVLRRPMSLFAFFTTLFSGGLVPYYILVTQYLHLKNTFFVLMIPQMVGVFQLLILRTAFAQLPDELFDAARVDGASEWRIFLQIALPLSKPTLATIGLMTAIAYWNNWTTALYFISEPKLYTLQYLLFQTMRSAEAMALEPQIGQVPMPLEVTRMAMVVLATGPAALAFLYVQKYLVKGITMGAFK